MDWVYTDGGGIAPTGAANKPGEHFVWQSTLYRGTLKFEGRLPGRLSVPGTDMAPGQRDTEGRGALGGAVHLQRPR